MDHNIKRIVTAVMLVALAGCSISDVLDSEDPDIVNPTDLQSTAGAAAAFAGGVGDFSFAIVGDAGGTEGQILVGGLMTDEYAHSGTFPTRLEYELRAIDERNGTLEAVMRNLHRARVSLRNAAALLQQYSDTSIPRIGEAFALEGYIYVFAAESYCSGVPFDGGVPLTTNEMLAVAEERFDTALTYLAASSTAGRLATVGKARALVNAGNYASAAALLGAVPTNFAYQTTHTITTGRQQNGVHVFNWISERWTVANNEGTTGLNFIAANDPRVQVDSSGGVGFDAATRQFNLRKFGTRTTPVPIANGVEARLIEAEAQLAAGGAWLTTLNTLRADSVNNGGFNLPALADPGTAAGRVDLLFRERAFWLYGTGHRLGDLRRLMRQYSRTEDAVFPTGTHFKGAPYGDDVSLPVPFAERNNVSFTGCNTKAP